MMLDEQAKLRAASEALAREVTALSASCATLRRESLSLREQMQTYEELLSSRDSRTDCDAPSNCEPKDASPEVASHMVRRRKPSAKATREPHLPRAPRRSLAELHTLENTENVNAQRRHALSPCQFGRTCIMFLLGDEAHMKQWAHGEAASKGLEALLPCATRISPPCESRGNRALMVPVVVVRFHLIDGYYLPSSCGDG